MTQFGGIHLRRNRQAVLVDQQPQRYRSDRNELIKRLEADVFEMCGSTEDIDVHHIRALRDMNVKGRREKPKWVQIMAARQRKTLVVCRTCHIHIHHGRKLSAQATVGSATRPGGYGPKSVFPPTRVGSILSAKPLQEEPKRHARNMGRVGVAC